MSVRKQGKRVYLIHIESDYSTDSCVLDTDQFVSTVSLLLSRQITDEIANIERATIAHFGYICSHEYRGE